MLDPESNSESRSQVVPVAATGSRGWSRLRSETRLLPWSTLIVVLAVSTLVHLWGLASDLPYAPDVDEPIFLNAAVQVASGHLSPGWFGHPGSTVIYPIAFLIRIWFAFTDPATLLHFAAPGLPSAFTADPAPFYLIGRLVSAAYGVGTVAVTWLVARRLANVLVATIAALVLPATWTVVYYGELIRTDTAGAFFALLCMLFLLRAIERQRGRDWVLAGATIGIAVSTRYFLVALVLPYIAAAVVTSGWTVRRPRVGRLGWWRAPAVGLAVAPITTIVTSPAALVHWKQVLRDLRFEARTVAPGADGLSPLGNFGWYIGQSIPAAVGVGLLVAAGVGLVLTTKRNPVATIALGTFALAYLVAVSLSPLHWDRYVVPIVPVIAVFAAIGMYEVVAAASTIAKTRSYLSLRSGPAGRAARLARPTPALIATAIPVATSLIALLMLWPSAQVVAREDHLRAMPSTRVAVTEWAKAGLPQGALVCEEMYTTYAAAGVETYRVFALANFSLADYRAKGCRVLISSSAITDRFVNASRYPVQAAFYTALARDLRLTQTFAPGANRGGTEIRVYEWAP